MELEQKNFRLWESCQKFLTGISEKNSLDRGFHFPKESSVILRERAKDLGTLKRSSPEPEICHLPDINKGINIEYLPKLFNSYLIILIILN